MSARFLYPRCGSARGAATSGSVSKEARGMGGVGCGGIDEAPLQQPPRGPVWLKEES